MQRALATFIVILLVIILPSGYYVSVSTQVPAYHYLPIFISYNSSSNELSCDLAVPIRGACSQTHCEFRYHLLSINPDTFVTWLNHKTNCTTVYYVQVLAPITLLTCVHHHDYLDGEVLLFYISSDAGNNTNITLANTSSLDYAKLAAVNGGVVFLTIVAALILRRWKKQSTYPSPDDPVSSPEIQMSYVDPTIPTSITPEKISDVKLGEASSQEEGLTGSVRRSSNSEVKRNPSRSTKRRPVSTRPILLVNETEDRSTEEEEDCAPQPPRASPKVKRKSQRHSDRAPHDVDNSNNQGLGSASNSPPSMGSPTCTPDGYFIPHHAPYCPICGHPFSRPCGSSNGSASNSANDLGSPMYMANPGRIRHFNPYHPTHLHPYPPPMSPYGYNIGGPGTIVNSGVGNILVTMSDIANNDSVNNAYCDEYIEGYAKAGMIGGLIEKKWYENSPPRISYYMVVPFKLLYDYNQIEHSLIESIRLPL
ncbi:hypothetical protein BYT27DRAFT_7215914 [Phlegmacium glaucopus]|nr:hypothetical protein BYT27DRAFT_7215914 [Phlegmacium glaucopus]